MQPSVPSTLRNQKWVALAEGVNGLPKVVLVHPSVACAEFYRHGAHVTSWKNAQGTELLFLSAESWFERGRPIRGGIPVVFPQFNDNPGRLGQGGPLPKHGFARTSEWTLTNSGRTKAGEVFATLRLEENPDTLRIWPFRFHLEFSVRLSDALEIRLAAMNTGDRPFRFQIALHTYFQVADICRTTVLGLKGIEFVDSLRNDVRERETGECIAFDQETDRLYVNAPDRLSLRDKGNHRTMVIQKSGMKDVVVWNPWIDKSRRMEDFGDDEYLRMVCVETGNIDTPVDLTPGSRWEGATTLSVVSD